jgi:hypothetical protein
LLLSGCSPPVVAAAGAGIGIAAQSLGVVDAGVGLVKSALPVKPQVCVAETAH